MIMTKKKFADKKISETLTAIRKIVANEMVREIRDKHYRETKDLSVAEQIKFFRKKSEKLQRKLKPHRSAADTRLVGSSR